MPWNGLTEPEGTERLVCDPDLDGDGNGGDPEIGSFLGGPEVFPVTAPLFTIGTSDMSMEFLVLPRTGDISTLNPDVGPVGGIGDDMLFGVDPGTTIGMSPKDGANNDLYAQWRRESSGIEVKLTGFAPRAAWTHLCINYDRSGDMEFFDNGVSVGTASISADSAVSLPAEGIYPAAMLDNFVDSAIWFTPMAGFAVHSRLLTGPEIAANVAALDVGSYSETEARYKFGTFVNEVGASITPDLETDTSRMGASLTWTVPAAYAATMYAPKGTNGTVFIEDLSGKGRHYELFTDLAYSDADGFRAACAFSTLGVSP